MIGHRSITTSCAIDKNRRGGGILRKERALRFYLKKKFQKTKQYVKLQNVVN